MKKILFLALILLASAVIAPAQTIKERPADGTQLTPSEWQFQNLRYVDLLNRQNDLLNDRTTAICLTIGGSFLASITSSLIQGGMNDGIMATLFISSAVAAAVGSCWMLVNEFQMISNQKKINNCLTLRYGPDGVALQF